MKCKVVMNYPDSRDEFGMFVDGDKYVDCHSFEELHDLILVALKDSLDHIHVKLYDSEKEKMEFIVPFSRNVPPVLSIYGIDKFALERYDDNPEDNELFKKSLSKALNS